MIRIAARIGREWLERPGDLAFLSSIGVEFVDVEFGVFPGFDEGRGAPDRSSIGSVVDLLGGHGLRLERANYPKTEIMPYYLGQPEAGRVIDNLCRAAELCGEFEIPVMGVQNFDATVKLGRFVGEHSWAPGRGGIPLSSHRCRVGPRRGLAAPRHAHPRRAVEPDGRSIRRHRARGRVRRSQGRAPRQRPAHPHRRRNPANAHVVRRFRPAIRRSALAKRGNHVLRRYAL